MTSEKCLCVYLECFLSQQKDQERASSIHPGVSVEDTPQILNLEFIILSAFCLDSIIISFQTNGPTDRPMETYTSSFRMNSTVCVSISTPKRAYTL